jgi:uncharacterized NAD(P)/FAD-binding protein YdhS
MENSHVKAMLFTGADFIIDCRLQGGGSDTLLNSRVASGLARRDELEFGIVVGENGFVPVGDRSTVRGCLQSFRAASAVLQAFR